MLNFAVIGVGRMGKRHAFNLAHGLIGGVRLTAVCDTDPAALMWCEKRCKGARRYSTLSEMLDKEKLDGVLIATPHYFHEELAVECIKRGVNTLIEKPLAVTTAAAKRIIACAEKYPSVKVGVSFNQRSNRTYRKAKELLSLGALGDIVRADYIITDWYRSQAYYNQGGWRASYIGEGGGCLINQCVHQLDILSWLMGVPKRIYAELRTVGRDITVENDVAAIWDYPNFKCTFSASTHELKGTNRLEIACDKGKILIEKRKLRVYLHKSEREVNAETKRGYGFAPSTKRTFSYGFWAGLKDLIRGQQARSIKAFCDEISGKGRMLASVADGLNAVQLINGMYLSAWKNESVTLPLDDAEYESALEKAKEREANITAEG